MTCQGNGLLVSVMFHLGVFLLIAVGLPSYPSTGRSVHMDFSVVQGAMAGSAAQKPAKVKRSINKLPQTQVESGPPLLEARAAEIPEAAEHMQDEPELESNEQEADNEGVAGNAMAGAAEHGAKGRDFSYIKQLLQKNLKYPLVARRNGWEGRVIIAFVIACDGRVKSIEIVETSGRALLDRNAVDVVKRTVPFPKHNIETRVIIPIVYSLSEESV